MKLSKKDLTDIPLLVLVAANLLPLWGVCFLKWDAFYIILLYWSENLVIGFYNILKIAAAKVHHPIEHVAKLFFTPFFVVHYSGFMAIHGLFVLAFTKKIAGPLVTGKPWPCFLVFVQLLVGVIKKMLLAITPQMKFAILALFISHGVSFVYNYLLKGEYATAKPKELMNQPYARVVVMHIAVIAGGFCAMTIGSPVPLLFVLVIGKIILDVTMHLREHKNAKLLI